MGTQMTFTEFLDTWLSFDTNTFTQGHASTAYTIMLSTPESWFIEMNSYRVYISSPNSEDSLSISLNDRTLLYFTFSIDVPCERHFWHWGEITEEEYFQNSLVNPHITLSFDENKKVINVLKKINEHIGDDYV